MTRSTKSDAFDYVIVGAGSAGCVLADRLSSDPSKRVLLLEAGGADRTPLISIPKGIAKLRVNDKYTWKYHVTAESPDDRSTEEWIGGKVLGGSSSVNGMVWSRGHPLDYEDWGSLAGAHWGWNSIRQAYVDMEDHRLGGTEFRGVGGPLTITAAPYRYPLGDIAIAAGAAMGLPEHLDLNDPALDGVGYYSCTVRNAKRVSSAKAFLHPAESRSNLTVRTQAVVSRVVFSANRATGVECRNPDGTVVIYRADREVMLSAGSLMSPAILQRSGIGPADHLSSLGIKIVHDSPNVGRQLRDHVALAMTYRLVGALGFNHRFQGLGLVPLFAEYFTRRSGPAATGPFEVGLFTRVPEDRDRPNVQLAISPYTRRPGTFVPEKEPGFTVHATYLHPKDTGSVMIHSTDPAVVPDVRMNWLTQEEDQKNFVSMMRFVRRYVRQRPLAPYIGAELTPGRARTDEELLAEAKGNHSTTYHSIGSCAMGNDPSAVIDSELRVRGVEGLRVVDCASIPRQPSGNTNAPVMALAWCAAQLIEAG
jgi:choline dehydrogenase